MKLLLSLLVCMLASCTVIQGNRQKGTYLYASFGGDVKDLKVDEKSASIGEINNSKAALSAIRTVGTLGTAKIVNGMLETVNTNAANVELGNQATTRAIAAGKEATKVSLGAQKVQEAAIKAAAP